jgi:hypothetical protein
MDDDEAFLYGGGDDTVEPTPVAQGKLHLPLSAAHTVGTRTDPTASSFQTRRIRTELRESSLSPPESLAPHADGTW